jgi:hypothetical protein
MGFLSSGEVIEASVKDLMGSYIGQTPMKTHALLEKSLGKVLLIDEAYRLDPSTSKANSYQQEALDELVDCLTKPQFVHKVIVILAGYDVEMGQLMEANPGLSSRFPTELDFRNLDASQCYQLLRRQIVACGIYVDPSVETTLGTATISLYFDELSQLSGWGNGRDVETLAKEIVGNVFENFDGVGELLATEANILLVLEQPLATRKTRAIASQLRRRL